MSLQTHPSKFIPIATSDAGMCLTWQNWQDCGIDTLSFSLESLLMKPGLEILNSHSHLRHLTGWPGRSILNARFSSSYRAGTWQIKSSYDGSLFKITEARLQQLILHLAPDEIILPEALSHTFDPVSYNNIPVLQSTEAGFYVSSNCHTSELYFESNQPAQEGQLGHIYTEEGKINIKSALYEQSFIPLAADCHCPTCQQKLTRAYFHHLIEQTPLLAQRFLICHNVYYYSQDRFKM